MDRKNLYSMNKSGGRGKQKRWYLRRQWIKTKYYPPHEVDMALSPVVELIPYILEPQRQIQVVLVQGTDNF